VDPVRTRRSQATGGVIDSTGGGKGGATASTSRWEVCPRSGRERESHHRFAGTIRQDAAAGGLARCDRFGCDSHGKRRAAARVRCIMAMRTPRSFGLDAGRATQQTRQGFLMALFVSRLRAGRDPRCRAQPYPASGGHTFRRSFCTAAESFGRSSADKIVQLSPRQWHAADSRPHGATAMVAASNRLLLLSRYRFSAGIFSAAWTATLIASIEAERGRRAAFFCSLLTGQSFASPRTRSERVRCKMLQSRRVRAGRKRGRRKRRRPTASFSLSRNTGDFCSPKWKGSYSFFDAPDPVRTRSSRSVRRQFFPVRLWPIR